MQFRHYCCPLPSRLGIARFTLECSDKSMRHPLAHMPYIFYFASTGPTRCCLWSKVSKDGTYPYRREFSSESTIMQNGKYIAIWHHYGVNYLTQTHFYFFLPKRFCALLLCLLEQRPNTGVENHRCLYGRILNQQATPHLFVSTKQSPNNT